MRDQISKESASPDQNINAKKANKWLEFISMDCHSVKVGRKTSRQN